jgi:hypothetical protein
MNEAIAALGLKTNPFSPERVEDGNTVRFDFTAGPLSPEGNPSHLQYYFDIYKWSDSQLVGNIGADGRLRAFPDQVGRPGMIIVISGFSGTGRTSLINLMRYEIRKRANPAPLVIEYSIQITGDRIQDARNFATRIIGTVAKATASDKRKEVKNLSKKMQATFADWKENATPQNANTDFLFQGLALDLEDALPGAQIVFSLDATDYMNTPDTWRPTCTMLRHLSNYIILSLSNRDHAIYLLHSLTKNAPVVWVDAPRVDASTAKRFLANRLASERNAQALPGQDLFPFTDEAIEALFAPTAGGDPVPLSISIAVKKLKSAFDRKVTDVTADLADPAAAAQRSPASHSISGADMRRTFL